MRQLACALDAQSRHPQKATQVPRRFVQHQESARSKIKTAHTLAS